MYSFNDFRSGQDYQASEAYSEHQPLNERWEQLLGAVPGRSESCITIDLRRTSEHEPTIHRAILKGIEACREAGFDILILTHGEKKGPDFMNLLHRSLYQLKRHDTILAHSLNPMSRGETIIHLSPVIKSVVIDEALTDNEHES